MRPLRVQPQIDPHRHELSLEGAITERASKRVDVEPPLAEDGRGEPNEIGPVAEPRVLPPVQAYSMAENSTTPAFNLLPIVESKDEPSCHMRPSKAATNLYTVAYLIFFSILGTLARLGLQALTFFPGAPVQTSVLWANFGGSLLIGFLSEDHRLFQEEWGVSEKERGTYKIGEDTRANTAMEMKRHTAIKKTIPLYIGLATGFCGSFTSFSSFIRDAFFALSNSLSVPVSHSSQLPISSSSIVPRNGGFDFMALIAVIIITTTACIGALHFGAHVAIALGNITPIIPYVLTRKVIDRVFVFVAFGAWVGAIVMAIWPPDRPGGTREHATWVQETWRGEAIFALVFAPLGCLLRFYVSLYLNGKFASFPLGTFAVNMFGTAILGMLYNLQHTPLGGSSSGMIGGGKVGCQVLQGGMDGFCGCLTTVSTWVAELNSLKRKHGYFYGATSVTIALALLVVIMGSLQWTMGFGDPACVT